MFKHSWMSVCFSDDTTVDTRQMVRLSYIKDATVIYSLHGICAHSLSKICISFTKAAVNYTKRLPSGKTEAELQYVIQWWKLSNVET